MGKENELLNVIVDLVDTLMNEGGDLESIRYILESHITDPRIIDLLLANYDTDKGEYENE